MPEASSPFFTTLTVSRVVDDRGAVPRPVAEETMLLGRVVGAAQARGHLAVAAALTERLGGRTDLALALLDDAIARFTALGDTFGIGYALGQRGHTLRWAGDLTGPWPVSMPPSRSTDPCAICAPSRWQSPGVPTSPHSWGRRLSLAATSTKRCR